MVMIQEDWEEEAETGLEAGLSRTRVGDWEEDEKFPMSFQSHIREEPFDLGHTRGSPASKQNGLATARRVVRSKTELQPSSV